MVFNDLGSPNDHSYSATMQTKGGIIGAGAHGMVINQGGSKVTKIMPLFGEDAVPRVSNIVETVVSAWIKRVQPRGVIHIHDVHVDCDDGRSYITMERGNETLLGHVNAMYTDSDIVAPDRAEFVLDVLTQLLQSLRSLHSYGILHGDMKPHNVVVVQGTWKVIDFGASLLIDLGGPTVCTAMCTDNYRWVTNRH